MQQDHVPASHAKDLFLAWQGHVAEHFTEVHSNDAGSKVDLDQVAHSFLEWLCTRAPGHLVESFVPGAHEYRKPTKPLVTHINALSNARHALVIPQLKELLHEHAAQNVRVAAVGALGLMRSLEAEEILLQHIGEAQPDFRIREEVSVYNHLYRTRFNALTNTTLATFSAPTHRHWRHCISGWASSSTRRRMRRHTGQRRQCCSSGRPVTVILRKC
jgi:hypothetical protein